MGGNNFSCGFQDNLPVVPPGCSSEKPETIQDFITKAKAALVSVGIVRDTVLGNNLIAIQMSKTFFNHLCHFLLTSRK